MNIIKQIKNLKNRTVLLRGDLDAPLKNGKVADNFRLKRLLPTIEYLSDKSAKIIIIGHLGRPGGKFVKELSVKPVAEELKRLLNIKNKKIRNLKLEIRNLEFKGFFIKENICLLENLRFYKGEESNNLKFAEKLAGLGDIFINDAFANSHRKHASIAGVAKYLPAFAGLNLMEEIRILSKAMSNPKRPAVAILGGAKLETKLPLITKMAEKFDYVLAGGKLSIEMSLKKQKNKEARKQNIVLPIDYVGAGKFDIGEQTIKLYVEILKKAKTIIWNGPMGKYEDERYSRGTRAIAKAISLGNANTIVGGGDLIAALGQIKMLNKMDFVSTGGGAMLEFLENGTLDGLKAIGFYKYSDRKTKTLENFGCRNEAMPRSCNEN
ncbi:MAG: phosphoglycerate kinase [bacterium]